MGIRDSLGDRVKRYERAYQHILTPRSCLFIRIDGNHFHTWTKGMAKPFDRFLIESMERATIETAHSMAGFKLAYVQSDEATFMLTDFDNLETQGWFGYELNKVVSVSASLFTAHFNAKYPGREPATFDSRAFIVPTDDAPNVFLWRYKDWLRNSVQMFAHAHFSHKELLGKKIPEIHEMLYQQGLNWADLNDQIKNGTFIDHKMNTLHIKASYEVINDLMVNGE